MVNLSSGLPWGPQEKHALEGRPSAPQPSCLQPPRGPPRPSHLLKGLRLLGSRPLSSAPPSLPCTFRTLSPAALSLALPGPAPPPGWEGGVLLWFPAACQQSLMGSVRRTVQTPGHCGVPAHRAPEAGQSDRGTDHVSELQFPWPRTGPTAAPSRTSRPWAGCPHAREGERSPAGPRPGLVEDPFF